MDEKELLQGMRKGESVLYRIDSLCWSIYVHFRSFAVDALLTVFRSVKSWFAFATSATVKSRESVRRSQWSGTCNDFFFGSVAGQRRGSTYWRQAAMCRTPSAESTPSDSAEENRAISPISPSGDKAKFPVPATGTAIASRLGDDRLSTMRERSRALVAFQANSLDLPARGKVLLSLQDKQFSSDVRNNDCTLRVSYFIFLGRSFQRELSGYLITKMKGKAGWKRFWLTVANSCFNFYRSHEVTFWRVNFVSSCTCLFFFRIRIWFKHSHCPSLICRFPKEWVLVQLIDFI